MSHSRGAAPMFWARWGAVVVWGALMLVATSLPGSTIPTVSFALSDKLVHFSMYAVLGCLVARSLGGPREAKAFLAALAWLFVAGLLDELHQALIPGRSADVHDWLADAVGALLGMFVGTYLLPLAPSRRPTP